MLRDRVVICPRNAESEIDEVLVGILILAPTFLRVYKCGYLGVQRFNFIHLLVVGTCTDSLTN